MSIHLMILIGVFAVLVLLIGFRSTEESKLEIEKGRRNELDETLTSGYHQFPKILAKITTQERIITLTTIRIYIINLWILLILLAEFINLIHHIHGAWFP